MPANESFRHALILSAVFITFLSTGCGSAKVLVAKAPPAKYHKLGTVTGDACGTLGLVWPTTSFVPMGLNSRVQDAYQEAIESVPGAIGLVNVEYKEYWFWWVLATTRCTTITGDAIKEAL